MSDLPEPIEIALAQTSETQAKLASGVEELAVTNAVLQKGLPEAVRTGDVALAIRKNEALENRVQECVDDLDSVSQALAAEVQRRKKLEKKLKQSGTGPPKSTTS